MTNNTHSTFSPTALKHFLKYLDVTSKHLHSIIITTTTGWHLTFPSILTYDNNQVLDYYEFTVVCLLHLPSSVPTPLQANKSYTSTLTRALVHQQPPHCNPLKLDDICHKSTLIGLPKQPSPSSNKQCPICLMSNFSHPPKGKPPLLITLYLAKTFILILVFGIFLLTMASHLCYSL